MSGMNKCRLEYTDGSGKVFVKVYECDSSERRFLSYRNIVYDMMYTLLDEYEDGK